MRGWECRKGILHQLEISRDLPKATIEVCLLCGEKKVYNKIDGRIDNKRYLEDHKRDFIQPYGKDLKLFIKLYGTEPIERARAYYANKLSKEKRQEIREELKEKRKFLHRKASGHTFKDNWEPPPLIKKIGFQNGN